TTIVIATHNEAMVERMGFPCLQLEDGALHISGAQDQPMEADDDGSESEEPFVLTAMPGNARYGSEGRS
ncbi:MAG: hypothetical protein ACO3MW_15015, partial [Rhodospirillales bacterium]